MWNDDTEREPLCSECDTPLRTSEAHVCDTCIAEDDFDREHERLRAERLADDTRFEFDIDAYIDGVYDDAI